MTSSPTPPQLNSHWLRPSGRSVTARRADDGGSVSVDDYTQLERAIYLHDIMHPPARWAYVDWTDHPGGAWTWTLGPWTVIVDCAAEDVASYRKALETAPWKARWKLLRDGWRYTKQQFRTADRARHYAETRLDRSTGPTRGPRPRGAGATLTLPDVRATKPERDAAVSIAAAFGCRSYSAFAREAVRFLTVLQEQGVVTLQDGNLVLQDKENK